VSKSPSRWPFEGMLPLEEMRGCQARDMACAGWMFGIQWDCHCADWMPRPGRQVKTQVRWTEKANHRPHPFALESDQVLERLAADEEEEEEEEEERVPMALPLLRAARGFVSRDGHSHGDIVEVPVLPQPAELTD
jgi:hypothetical protein